MPNQLVLVGNEKWFLVHTRTKCEHKAQYHLHAQGFRTFLPLIKRTIRHARQFRTTQTPLFPRYFFIALDLERDRWLSVSSTVGVSTLVSSNGCPTPVPAGIVDSFIGRPECNLVRLDCGWIKGQKVRVLSGPFADLSGTLERLDAAGRVRVLLKMMGTTVPISMDRSALSRAVA